MWRTSRLATHIIKSLPNISVQEVTGFSVNYTWGKLFGTCCSYVVCDRWCQQIILHLVFFSQVIYRALSPPYSADDPYSPEAQAQLKVTNLRVQLLKQQSCPCDFNELNGKPPQLTYYSIYDFIVKGSCFCNGHADHCVPIKGFRPIKAAGVFHVVSIN